MIITAFKVKENKKYSPFFMGKGLWVCIAIIWSQVGKNFP